MSKELAGLQDLKNAFISHCKTLGCEDTYIKICENKFDIIETELKNQKRKLDLRGLNLSSIDQALEIIMRDPDAVFNTIDLYNDWEEYDEDCINENVTTYPFKSKEEFDLLKEVLCKDNM